MTHDEFTEQEIRTAWIQSYRKCECCGKPLVWSNQGRNSGSGCWEAHHGGRNTPIILCAGGKEYCHLNCGHDGDYHNEGITPRVHKGG